MLRRAVWALAALGSIGLSTAVAHADCTKDTDCKGDRVCDAGKCTWPKGSTPPAVAPTAPATTPTAPQPVAPAPSPPAAAPVAPLPAPPAPAQAPAVAPPAPVTYAPPPGYMAVPMTQPADKPILERRSKSAMIAGIVMVSIGPVALLGALAARNSQESCDTALTNLYPNHVLPTSERYRLDQCDAYSVPIYLLGIGGAVLTAVGVPLLVYGSKQIKKPQTALEVQPWATPVSGGLSLRLTL